MFTRILVPLDGSALAERALPYATRLASTTRGRLILLHTRLLVEPTSEPDFDLYGFAEALREREQAVAVGASRPFEVNALVREAYPEQVADEICMAADNQSVDLVVMSTHGHGGLGRWLYGSVADQVIRQSKVPVLLISAACDQHWADDGPLRILVPLDGSRLAEEILGPVDDLAAVLGADVLLVGAAGPFDYAYTDGAPAVRAGFDTALAEVQTYLDRVAERLRNDGRTVEIEAEVGRPGPVIEAAARDARADLIAMATHGRSGLARLALGSVATETLQRATVPVLLARPAAVRQSTAAVAEPTSDTS